MRQKIALGLAWTKVGALTLLGLYAAGVLLANYDAHIEPGLHLGFVKYDKPNALLTLFIASAVSVAGCYLALTLYRSVRQVKTLTAQKKLHLAERELASLRQTASPSSLTPGIPVSGPGEIVGGINTAKRDDTAPIPLE